MVRVVGVMGDGAELLECRGDCLYFLNLFGWVVVLVGEHIDTFPHRAVAKIVQKGLKRLDCKKQLDWFWENFVF